MTIVHLWACLAVVAFAMATPAEAAQTADAAAGPAGIDRSRLGEPRGIVWDVAADRRLPHDDHLEMSGQKVSFIVHYGADANGNLKLRREVIWPMLRTRPRDMPRLPAADLRRRRAAATSRRRPGGYARTTGTHHLRRAAGHPTSARRSAGDLPFALSSWCNPRLPRAWPGMCLRHVKAFGRDFDLEVPHPPKSDCGATDQRQDARLRARYGNRAALTCRVRSYGIQTWWMASLTLQATPRLTATGGCGYPPASCA